ncbi:MAG: hypothetical protein HQK76_15925 [Desulfobacterales bacterium]|nr:hypothetical protein [Desulfobacterales bacterium]
MLIYNDIYSWKGWGGILRLGSGKCRLKIHDIKKDGRKGVLPIKPIIIIVTDAPNGKMSVRGCASHIASCLVNDFKLNPSRILYVEYYPKQTYGINNQSEISEKYEIVEFTWHGSKAIKPVWREVNPNLLELLKDLNV